MGRELIMSFNTINYLLFDKRRRELSNELLEEFNPWMTTRYFSFYNDGVNSDYINETLNRYGNLFKIKEDQFRFYEHLIPVQKRKKLSYMKKNKVDKKDLLPIPEFLSRREIDMFEDMSKYHHERTSSSID